MRIDTLLLQPSVDIGRGGLQPWSEAKDIYAEEDGAFWAKRALCKLEVIKYIKEEQNIKMPVGKAGLWRVSSQSSTTAAL